MARSRLDIELVNRGLIPSREKAKVAVLAGKVMVNGQKAAKPSDWVRPEDELSLSEPEKYVSRGGFKLEHAIHSFGIKLSESTVALDIGASTGGFTDCLLQEGAGKVYAIDVGQGQLAWKLRQDERVVVMERLNARFLDRSHFDEQFRGADIIVVDCSFISLRLILPPIIPFLKPGGRIVALIKPQFEAGKGEVARGKGVISNPEIHQRVLVELEEFCKTLPSIRWGQVVQSPLLGPAGNKEFLVYLDTEKSSS
jgi:23S rRNA (cytidine1920-2'-O)/16S rRNA (cytidine1409-2'-O)-methyltransferase